jgi:hypothetical protein
MPGPHCGWVATCRSLAAERPCRTDRGVPDEECSYYCDIHKHNTLEVKPLRGCRSSGDVLKDVNIIVLQSILKIIHEVSRCGFQAVLLLPAAWGIRKMIGSAGDRKIVSQQQYLMIDTLVPSVRITASSRYVEHVPEIGVAVAAGVCVDPAKSMRSMHLSFDNATITLSCLATDSDMTAVDKRSKDFGRCR